LRRLRPASLNALIHADAYPRDLIGYGRTPPHADWPAARGSPSSWC
jgi:hypothetical protein